MELWDIFDENRVPTGRTVERGGFVLKPGEYHLVVHIWVITSKGDILIQRRSDEKELMPGEWAATGGAAISGEDSFTAARRELQEELGIFTDRNTLKPLISLKRKNSFLDVWFTVCDLPIDRLTIQASEVAEIKLVSKDELKKMIEEGHFHRYGNDYFEQVFAAIDEKQKELVLL